MITLLDPMPFTWTREEYQQLTETGIFAQRRVELIEGQVLKMNAMGPRHSVALTLLNKLLMKVFGDHFNVQIQQPLAISDASMPEPDASITSGDPRDYRDSIPESALLVIEVADTTLRFDRTTKARIYANANIMEYWIINLTNEQVEIHRQPVMNSGYVERKIAKRGEQITPLCVPGITIQVDDLLP